MRNQAALGAQLCRSELPSLGGPCCLIDTITVRRGAPNLHSILLNPGKTEVFRGLPPTVPLPYIS